MVRSNGDKYDIDELYEFADHTGILERHRQLLAKPFHENQVLQLFSQEQRLYKVFQGRHEDHVLRADQDAHRVRAEQTTRGEKYKIFISQAITLSL